MNLNKITDQILHFEAETLKELTLTFCRVQEFYESPHANIREKKFDLFDFIFTHMDDDGELAYFYSWHGFNFHSHVYGRWLKTKPTLTPLERKLVKDIKKNTDSRPFYVIATVKGIGSALHHEMAHAMFFLYEDYKAEVLAAINQIDPELQGAFNRGLYEMGYGEEVFQDETHAYLATSSDAYLMETFSIDADEHRDTINTFVSIFEKYNNKVRK